MSKPHKGVAAVALTALLTAPAAPATAQIIEGTDQSVTYSQPATTPEQPQRPSTYRIRRGDTLSGLAARFGLTTIRLARLNRISNAWHIEVGDLLRTTGRPRWNGKVRLFQPRPRPSRSGSRTPASSSADFVIPAPGSWDTYPGHTGVDINIPGSSDLGNPVRASEAGVVEETHYWWHSFGHHVIVRHASGLRTIYAHLSRIYASVGQQVAAGQVLGLVGSTGNSSGPHLHFEVEGHGYSGTLTYLQRGGY